MGRVLVGCEFSGIVRNEFAKLGHDAWSCDLLPTESEGNHIQDDILKVLDRGWDLAIFHLYWETEKDISITFDLISIKTDDIEYMLYSQSDDNKIFYIEENYDKILKKIKTTRDYKAFQIRINKECEWADKYDRTHDSLWMYDILDVAESRIYK